VAEAAERLPRVRELRCGDTPNEENVTSPRRSFVLKASHFPDGDFKDLCDLHSAVANQFVVEIACAIPVDELPRF
jgi:hypothetical protein